VRWNGGEDMSEPYDFEVTFDQGSALEKEELAGELERFLPGQVPGILVDVEVSGTGLDFGVTIGIVLGSASAVAIARGIEAYLKQRTQAKISIKDKFHQTIISGVSSEDAVRLYEMSRYTKS
jgi:hypothetical protein